MASESRSLVSLATINSYISMGDETPSSTTSESSMSLVTRNAKQEMDTFKKPLRPPPKKKKRKVLNEEKYLKKLDAIIERDFFPDLEELKDKVEYMAAKETNDVVRLREIYMKYSDGSRTPNFKRVEDSPSTFETPERKEIDDDNELFKNIGQSYNRTSDDDDRTSVTSSISKKDMSLDEFLFSHTSEDNASFEDLMELQEKRFRLKNAWMFDAEDKHNVDYIPNLALPTCEDRAQAEKLSIQGTSIDKDTRPKSVENWKFQTYNSVMYVPDAVPPSQAVKIELAKKKKREVLLENTRFDGNPFKETMSSAAMVEATMVQQSKKEGKVGVDGKELGKDTPGVNGYKFIRDPSPAPGVDASPLMTWGAVEGTPAQLDGSRTPLLQRATSGPAYSIPKVTHRDTLGKALADRASQKQRDRKVKAISLVKSRVGTPNALKFGQQPSRERIEGMSPAAQKLLNSKLGVRVTSDKALRASYTPTPSSRHDSTPGAKTPTAAYLSARRTPRTPGTPRTPKTGNQTPTLTDNLLNLLNSPMPRTPEVISGAKGRPTAKDFF